MLASEEELLEQIPVPGVPEDERARRKAWLALPRKARVAIRRMHEEWGHMPSSVIIEILKLAKAPEEYVQAALNMRCTACDVIADPKQTSKVSPPSLNYVLNDTVGNTVLMYLVCVIMKGGVGCSSILLTLARTFRSFVSCAKDQATHLQECAAHHSCRAG